MLDYSQYGVEFLTIAFAHLIAVTSPGPDFAIVMKYSINYGKRIALLTSLGVGSAIFLHVTYALAGIGLVISTTPWLYNLLIIVASSFLLYLGFGAIRSQPVSEQKIKDSSPVRSISSKKAFLMGFLTNGINPKATLFFLALFTVVVDINTPLVIKGLYGLYMAIATAIWFCFLSLILTHKRVQHFFQANAYLFDRVMGVVMIGLALNILVNEFLL
jgi:threonine/homoserine/homoserine lactone efflux protein